MPVPVLSPEHNIDENWDQMISRKVLLKQCCSGLIALAEAMHPAGGNREYILSNATYTDTVVNQ